MNTIEHLNWRYATKKFDPNFRLSSEKINILKEAFNLTALSYGLQTLKLVILSNKNKQERLIEHSYGQKQVFDASHLLIICIQNEISTNDVDIHFDTIASIRKTPKTILDPFRKQLSKTINNMSLEEKEEWATRQAYIALGNLMTVCALEKIDSCPMEGFNAKAFDDILNLGEKGLKSVLLLPVGKRAEDDMFAEMKKVRKPISNTVIELY